jgi:O-antigen/teichoic acid export membrane protein
MFFKYKSGNNILEFLEANFYKFISLFLYFLTISLLANILDKEIFSEYSKIFLWTNIFILLSTSGINLFFFDQYNKKKRKTKSLINFLLFDYLIVNIIIFFILFFTEKNYLFFDFKINTYLFFFFFNSSLTLILISLISKKNIGINKTIIYENLFKNLLFFIVILIVISVNFNSDSISRIIYGYTISCYFLSLLLFVINYKFLSKIYNKIHSNKNFFLNLKKFFHLRISRSIISCLIVLETNLPIIFFTYYKLNNLIADYHILLTLLMFLNFLNINIHLNIFEKFLKFKKKIKKIENIVADSFTISLPFVIAISIFLMFFWNFVNFYILDEKFDFDKILILLLITLYLSDYLFGNNHIFYISRQKNLNNYIFLFLFLILISSTMIIVFSDILSLKLALSIMIFSVLIRNLFLHFSIRSFNFNISFFNPNLLFSIKHRLTKFINNNL